jgi:calcineurin-like phosphoesterase family protein
MSRTWFTSDTHFGHANIIRFCARPFESVGAIDAAMIANWNATVRPDDVIWHLGDFVVRSARSPDDYLRRLNGRKHLVHGNHDTEASRTSAGWASSQPFSEVSVEGFRLVLLHYGMRVWPGDRRGALHLYGHSHGNLPGDRQSLDVGVDVWGFRPVSLAEIRARMATLPERAIDGSRKTKDHP